MRLRSSTLLAALLLVAAPLVAGTARASDIVDGKLVFAKDALATYSFESIADLQAAGAGKLTWVNVSGYQEARPETLVDTDDKELLVGGGLEGKRALRVAKSSPNIGLAIQDPAVLSTLAGKRISVSMWGRAVGAEPVLQLVFSRETVQVGPELINIVAVRTGRETKDGWVEYATGPIDGSALGSGTAPLASIVLTARYPTQEGQTLLVDYDLNPDYAPYNLIDSPDGYAVLDAVEIRPEPGAAGTAKACTMATAATACGAGYDCMFGHCFDETFFWGPAPQAKDHRHDLAERWGFIAQSLQSDRQSIATAATVFNGAAGKLEGESTPRYFAKLNDMVAELHDSHTNLGTPSTYDDGLFPIAYAWSGPMDVCFGLADDDIGLSGNVYSVFQIEGASPFSSKLQKGDIVTAIDGMPPDDWLDLVKNRMGYLPPDPAALPSHNAIHMGELVGRYATTLSLSRCTIAGGCAALPDLAVADTIFAELKTNEWPGGFSHACSLRFTPSVSSPPSDDSSTDAVVVETSGGVTSVQFDGFQGLYGSNSNPYAAWKDPMTSAFTNANVLVDARVGWGGRFYLGTWLFAYLRANDQPYGMFSVPRGTIEDPDPPWLLSSIFDTCPTDPQTESANICGWEGYNSAFTQSSTAGGEAAKIAWVNGNDVSMNDIVPRLMQGRANFRVFGPHPSHGSYGEFSSTVPVSPGWGAGGIQVLDMRFGVSPDDARTQRWESGHGVVPDEVVAQKVSDILNDQDTVLLAAKAWLLQ
jgi:hypothetical protein